MGKIYRRDTLIKNVAPKKRDEKDRKRNVIINFRVMPEEKVLIDNRIALSGLTRSEYFIQSCLHNEIHTTGNIRTFDEMRKQIKQVDDHLCSIYSTDELELEILESLRTLVEILNSVYGEDE